MPVRKFRLQQIANRALGRRTSLYGIQISAIFPYGPPGTPDPDPELVRLVLDAARHAAASMPSLLVERCVTSEQRAWATAWPGEHYRLLPALASVLGGGPVVEVGTFTGMGTLALSAEASRVVTYDVVPWRSVPDTVLRSSDFDRENIEQRLGDLSDPTFFASQSATLAEAALVFVDGPKDYRFEPFFTKLLASTLRGSGKIVVFDDIRVANMVRLWGTWPGPKLDATSLGHWSGTGIVRL